MYDYVKIHSTGDVGTMLEIQGGRLVGATVIVRDSGAYYVDADDLAAGVTLHETEAEAEAAYVPRTDEHVALTVAGERGDLEPCRFCQKPIVIDPKRGGYFAGMCKFCEDGLLATVTPVRPHYIPDEAWQAMPDDVRARLHIGALS